MNPRITRLWGADGLAMVGITYRKGGRVVLVTIRRDMLGGWQVKTGVWQGWVPTMRRAFAIGKLWASLRIADIGPGGDTL
jgi:hypothetical protein